MMLWTFLGT